MSVRPRYRIPASCAARRTPAIGSMLGKRSGARGETAAIVSDSGEADRFGPRHVAYRCAPNKPRCPAPSPVERARHGARLLAPRSAGPQAPRNDNSAVIASTRVRPATSRRINAAMQYDPCLNSLTCLKVGHCRRVVLTDSQPKNITDMHFVIGTSSYCLPMRLYWPFEWLSY